MDNASARVEFFGKRYTFLGHQDVQLRVGSYVLFIAKNLGTIPPKLADIIIKGIDENEKCIILCDEQEKSLIGEALEAGNKSVDTMIRQGQFIFITDRQHLFGSKEISMDTFFCQLQGFIDDTCLQGRSALRIVTDIQWLLDAGGKSKDFLVHETELFTRFSSTRVPVLFFAYMSGTQISPKNLIEVTNTHPMILFDENFMTSSKTDSANIDNLTGLFNQTHFREILKKEIARCTRYNRPCSMVIFAIDDFKHINRQYGYAKGDELLLNLSTILLKNARNVDIPGRFAGGEFATLLPETPKTGAVVMANRVLRLVAETIHLEEAPTTLCAGIAQYPGDGSNDGEIMENAAQALRIAQRKGKNQVCLLEDSTQVS